MNLMEIKNLYKAIDQALENSMGEITPGVEVLLAIKESDPKMLERKAEDYNFAIQKLKADADFWRERRDAIDKMVQACKATSEKIKKNFEFAMKELGLEEIQGETMTAKLQKSPPSLNIINEAEIPEYFKIIEIKFDKAKIKEVLKTGEPVDGCELVSDKHVVFRVRKK